MKPDQAGELCDRLDQSLRGSETNLTKLASLIVVVLRKQAWKARRIRTGQIVECASFRELLTAPPLKGFGEDPVKVEALLREDAEALTLFRNAMTAPQHVHKTDGDNNNVIVRPKQGNSRAYTLTRLQRQQPALYADVVAGRLTANAAAIKAGFRSKKTALDQLSHWWTQATRSERAAFLRSVRRKPQ